MQLSRAGIADLCRLAQLEVTPREEAALQGDLARILSSMRTLDESSVPGGDEPPWPPAGGALRADRARAGVSAAAALREAPQRRGDFFTVPTVVELTRRKPAGN